MERKGTIKMNVMEIFENPEDMTPLFRLHVEITDIDFDRIDTLPQVRVDYKVK